MSSAPDLVHFHIPAYNSNTLMSSHTQKLVQHIFFFIVLATAAYLVWNLLYPFLGALALAAIVTIICYPMYERILTRIRYGGPTLAALISVLLVLLIIVVPIIIITSFILREATSIYAMFNTSDKMTFVETVQSLESAVQKIAPSFSLHVAEIVQQAASFMFNHLVSLFAGTASTIFLFFIALIATFYFFRDGKHFTSFLVALSPLKNSDDEKIMSRLALAVRSVAVGTVTMAIVQGVLTAFGLSLFGFDRAILWGCVAAIGALVPGVGTTIVFIPAVIYLVISGLHVQAFLLALWGIIAVGLIDNILGPYVMSRGNKAHPFLILLAVLGGIAMFGPIGFILGPVILSFFIVLLEIYNQQVIGVATNSESQDQKIDHS